MRLFDTHVHLDVNRFDRDRDLVLRRAAQQGVVGMLNVGFDLSSSRAALALADAHSHIWAAAGLHPHHASQFNDEFLQDLRLLLGGPRAVALGEIGLDFYRDLSPREDQRAAFEQLLTLAKALELPVIIHDRDAHEDVLSILTAVDIRTTGGVMHCFSGDRAFARRCLDLGLYISVAGPITYARSYDLREVVRFVPEERLLLETDCPYLPPVPYRGKRNEPAFVRLIGEAVAASRGCSLRELSETTLSNACTLFGIEIGVFSSDG